MVDIPSPRGRARNSGAWLEPLPAGAPQPARASNDGPTPRWRDRLADRWRTWLAYAAIGGAALVVVLATVQLLRGERAQRLAAERELKEKLMNATQMVVGSVVWQQGLVTQTLMAPVLLSGGPDTRPLRFEEFVAQGRLLQEKLGFDEDPHQGFFRVDLRVPAPWQRVERWGSMTDAGVAGAILLQQESRIGHYLSKSGGLFMSRLDVAGVRYHATAGIERDAAGRPVALLGHVAGDGWWTRQIIERQLGFEPILPETFNGVSWTTATRVAGEGPSRAMLRQSWNKRDIGNNRILAIRVSDRKGELRYQTPGTPDSTWTSPFAAEYTLAPAGIVVRTAIPEALGHRLVAATLPGTGRWLIAAIVIMGTVFTIATVVELRRQQALARARRDFVSAVSHELRTPLAHMAALSETLLMRGARTTDEQRDRWLRVIHREALRLGGIVGNVLHHEAASRALPPLDCRWVDLADVVAEAVESAAVLHERQGVAMCTALPPACMAWVDPGAVRQVLLNLLDNAVKYGPPGQQVRVSLHAPDDPDAPVELVVDDQGPGIAPRDRDRVWRAFERVGDAGNATGGSGLGLSVVRGIVRAHGGSAHVEDAPGGGARFVVRLPQGAMATAGA